MGKTYEIADLIGKMQRGKKLNHAGNYIQVFWAAIQGGERSPEYKLRLLVALSCIEYSVASRKKRRHRREVFNKDHKKEQILERWCFVCRNESEHRHRHHIVQLQHGGRNSRSNIVVLCKGCHNQVHRRAAQWKKDRASVVSGQSSTSQPAITARGVSPTR